MLNMKNKKVKILAAVCTITICFSTANVHCTNFFEYEKQLEDIRKEESEKLIIGGLIYPFLASIKNENIKNYVSNLINKAL